MSRRRPALVTIVAVGLAACASISTGRDFPSPTRETITNGTTTKADLVRLFGEPTQVGVKDGDQTWTWYYVRLKGGESDLTKQLEVTFAAGGTVKSYSFSSNFPEDLKTLR